MERLWAQSYHIWIIFTPLAVWRRPQRLSRPPFVQASPIKQVLQRCTNTQIGWNASLHTEKQNHLSLNRTNWNGLKQCSAHPGCHHLSVLLPGGVLVFFSHFISQSCKSESIGGSCTCLNVLCPYCLHPFLLRQTEIPTKIMFYTQVWGNTLDFSEKWGIYQTTKTFMFRNASK